MKTKIIFINQLCIFFKPNLKLVQIPALTEQESYLENTIFYIRILSCKLTILIYTW